MPFTIVVTEQVVMQGYEETVYESPYSLDEVKAMIVAAGDAESVAEVEVWQVTEWLTSTLSYTDSSFTGTSVMERGLAEVEQQ